MPLYRAVTRSFGTINVEADNIKEARKIGKRFDSIKVFRKFQRRLCPDCNCSPCMCKIDRR